MDGKKLLDHKDAPLDARNAIAQAMFTAWWFPFSRYGVIHGDPHLGNYSVFEEKEKPAGINLLDYGCIRIFPPSFVGGVVDLYRGLQNGDDALVVHAYETWGFKRLSRELIDTLNIWARSSTARCSTIASAPSPTASSRPNTAAGRPSGCIRRSKPRARSRCRGSSCSWTAPPSGLARCSCTCRRS